MNRQQKEVEVSDLKKLFSDAQAAFLVNYKGLDVAHLQNLRKGLREQKGTLRVTKANLMRIAVDNIEGTGEFKEFFKDQVGIVFANDNVPGVAKKLTEFSKAHEALKVVTGFFESKILSSQQINVLANLPSREILLAQVVGTIQAPISGLARVLSQLILRPIYAIKQIAEKK